MDSHWAHTDGNRISVWQADLAALNVVPLAETLSSDELARARRYRTRDDAERFVKARGVLRHVLASYTGIEPRALAIADGNGSRKPSLPDFPGIHFSISYAEDLAAVAVGALPLGIDLEPVRNDPDTVLIADTLFHQRERESLERVIGMDRIRAFYSIWTQKEAYVKALGVGLSMDVSTFAVSPSGGKIFQPAAAECRGQWYGIPIEPGPALCLALVSRFVAPKIEFSEVSKNTVPDLKIRRRTQAEKNTPDQRARRHPYPLLHGKPGPGKRSLQQSPRPGF